MLHVSNGYIQECATAPNDDWRIEREWTKVPCAVQQAAVCRGKSGRLCSHSHGVQLSVCQSDVRSRSGKLAERVHWRKPSLPGLPIKMESCATQNRNEYGFFRWLQTAESLLWSLRPCSLRMYSQVGNVWFLIYWHNIHWITNIDIGMRFSFREMTSTTTESVRFVQQCSWTGVLSSLCIRFWAKCMKKPWNRNTHILAWKNLYFRSTLSNVMCVLTSVSI